MNPDYPSRAAGYADYTVAYHESNYRAGYQRTMTGEYPAEVAKEYLADLVKESNVKAGRVVMFRHGDQVMFVYEVTEVERLMPVTTLELAQ